jgi:hypothetical protein
MPGNDAGFTGSRFELQFSGNQLRLFFATFASRFYLTDDNQLADFGSPGISSRARKKEVTSVANRERRSGVMVVPGANAERTFRASSFVSHELRFSGG